MTFRRAIFWIHLGVGASAAPEQRPSALLVQADPLAPAAVRFGRRQTLYVDRYSGEIRGDGDTRMRRFLRGVMYWHRWFALEDDKRPIGRAITGAANLGFLFLVVSGFYLWWPRTWTRRSLRSVTWFRRGLTPKARDFNWHNVVGFWMAVPLLIIVFSGAMISYRWVGDLIHMAVGEEPPARRGRSAAAASGSEPAATATGQQVSYESLLLRAAAESPGWRRLTLRIPDADDAPLTVRVDHGTGRQPAKWTNLTFDRATGALTARASGQPASRGTRIRFWLRFAHTGEVFGVVGQTIAGLASTGVTLLVWTGLSLTWRRFLGAKTEASDPSARKRKEWKSMTDASPRRRRAVQGPWLTLSLLLTMAACGPTGSQSREPTGDDDAWWTAVQEYVDLMAARKERTGDTQPTEGLAPRIVSE